MAEYYTLNATEAIKSLKSSEKGLTEEEAQKRLDETGYNELQKEKRLSRLNIFARQFKDPLCLLLIFAGILSLLLKEFVEAAAILVIVILNALLGFIQEYRAEKAIEALQKMSAPTARVLRDEKEHKIPAKELVPGDILLLEAGDIVPADSRLLEASSLQIDEASLTGESVPSKKTAEPFKSGTPLADQENMAFMGTIITYGKGKSIVTRTGMRTEFGKIAASLQTTEETQTPLQMKFAQLTKQLGIITVVLVTIVMVTGISREFPFSKMVLFALALTVSTIPNSLPLVVTVGLSMGTKELAKKNMLIKRLPAAESLGAATIICSDKTGTLTKNQMTVTDIFYDGSVIKVSGSGYEPEGNFYENNKQANPKKYEMLLRIGYLCNNSKLSENEGIFEIIGDPTEGALIVLGKKGGLDETEIRKKFSLIEELPFDPERKRMSSIFRNNTNKKTEAYVKGAPDLLLSVCSRILEKGKTRKLTKKDAEKILKMNESFGNNALRVLACGYKEIAESKGYDMDNVEKNLVFVGLVGMIDPPRDEVKQAIEKCHEAGIKVMIITGDHAITAKAVAEHIGLFEKGDIILSGKEIEEMNDARLEKKIGEIRIISRALPIQKLRIVTALQKNGHIVAMTGDGVNDAPALKKADIGIAMGITGTDVAKEVSDAVLTDDNFATIVSAIEVGRNTYDKLIKSAKFFLSCNMGEITAVFAAILLGFPLPLLPLQILLMNLLTDSFPAMGLGLESSEDGIMKRQPRNPKEKPLSKKMLVSIVLFGLIMGLGTLWIFLQYKEISLSKAQTAAFTTLVMFQMFAVMSSRTLYPSLKHLNPFSNLWLSGSVCLAILLQVIVIYWGPMQSIFGTVPLLAMDWAKIIGVSSLGFILMEASKFFLENINNANSIGKKQLPA